MAQDRKSKAGAWSGASCDRCAPVAGDDASDVACCVDVDDVLLFIPESPDESCQGETSG